jgi:hypothetical protein
MKKEYEKPLVVIETYIIESSLAASSVTPHFQNNSAVMEEWEEQDVELGKYNW